VTIEIKKAMLFDKDVLRALQKTLTKESNYLPYGIIEEEKDISILKNTRKTNSSYFKIIRIDGKTVGFSSLTKTSVDKGYIKIGVLKQYQRNGYGEMLLRNIIDDARSNNLHSLFLYVTINNVAGVALFLKNNFIIKETVNLKPFGNHYRMGIELTN